MLINTSNSNLYKYSFNGKEKDDEVKGSGNSYDYGARIYDPRLGKFFSVDALSHAYPWFTPYQFAGNTPISAIDLDGLENVYIIMNKDNSSSMQVEFTEDHVRAMINNKAIPFNVIYIKDNEVKTTKQFEGPNKQNERKIFETIAGVYAQGKVCEEIEGRVYKPGVGGEKAKAFKSGKFKVPGPPPVVVPSPLPPPTLDIKFNDDSDVPKDLSDAETEVLPLVDYLKKNPKSSVTLFGNTGIDPGDNSPTGSGPDVLGASAKLNGNKVKIGDLMKARADAVKDILKSKGISESRITTTTGTQGMGAESRNVGVDVKTK